MTRIASLAAAALTLALTAVAVAPGAPQAASGAIATHVALEGPVVQLQAQPDAEGEAWFDSEGLAQAREAQVAWLAGRVEADARQTCRDAGFDGVEVDVVEAYMDFPQPWTDTVGGAAEGPAQVGIVARSVCR